MNIMQKVRVDGIVHITPKKEGKKEWYIIHLSEDYKEDNGSYGYIHLNPVFLTPEQYELFDDLLLIDAIIYAVNDITVYNGRSQVNIIGFKKIEE